MKKAVVFIVLCCGLWAQAGDITFSVTQNSAGTFTIGYVATDPAAVPVGVGIRVSLTRVPTIDSGSAVTSTDSFFDVYVDFASEDPCNYIIGMAGQTPIADPCAAGQPAYGAGISEFSICMGALDPCNRATQTVANLVTIDVDYAGCYDVAISADNLRGGIVGAEWDNIYFVGITDLDCWQPISCWNYLTQCHGDADGDGHVDTTDWPYFRDGFNCCYPEQCYIDNRCADYNRDGCINTADWPAFRDNFNQNVPFDCPAGGLWPPTP